MIQGFFLVTPKKFMETVRSIMKAMSSIICSIVRYCRLSKVKDLSGPKGSESPKYRGYIAIWMALRLLPMFLRLAARWESLAGMKGGMLRMIGVLSFTLSGSMSRITFCAKVPFAVLE
jgi:hypothetical protein